MENPFFSLPSSSSSAAAPGSSSGRSPLRNWVRANFPCRGGGRKCFVGFEDGEEVSAEQSPRSHETAGKEMRQRTRGGGNISFSVTSRSPQADGSIQLVMILSSLLVDLSTPECGKYASAARRGKGSCQRSDHCRSKQPPSSSFPRARRSSPRIHEPLMNPCTDGAKFENVKIGTRVFCSVRCCVQIPVQVQILS